MMLAGVGPPRRFHDRAFVCIFAFRKSLVFVSMFTRRERISLESFGHGREFSCASPIDKHRLADATRVRLFANPNRVPVCDARLFSSLGHHTSILLHNQFMLSHKSCARLSRSFARLAYISRWVLSSLICVRCVHYSAFCRLRLHSLFFFAVILVSACALVLVICPSESRLYLCFLPSGKERTLCFIWWKWLLKIEKGDRGRAWNGERFGKPSSAMTVGTHNAPRKAGEPPPWLFRVRFPGVDTIDGAERLSSPSETTLTEPFTRNCLFFGALQAVTACVWKIT